MSKKLWTGLLSGLVVSLAVPAVALTVEEVPNPRKTLAGGGWVTDMANVLSPETEAELNRLITVLEVQNSFEIAVVTVPETAPSATPKAFATALFNYWGIGKAERDNGVLFLISIGDRRAEIETGIGIEPILSNQRVSEILEQAIIPHYRNGDYDQGTLAGTQALVDALADRQAVDFVDWFNPNHLAKLGIAIVALYAWWAYYHLTEGEGSAPAQENSHRLRERNSRRDRSSDFGGGKSKGGGSGSDW